MRTSLAWAFSFSFFFPVNIFAQLCVLVFMWPSCLRSIQQSVCNINKNTKMGHFLHLLESSIGRVVKLVAIKKLHLIPFFLLKHPSLIFFFNEYLFINVLSRKLFFDKHVFVVLLSSFCKCRRSFASRPIKALQATLQPPVRS